MNLILRKPRAALAGLIAIVLTACGGGNSGGSGGDSGDGATMDAALTPPSISAPAENQPVVTGEPSLTVSDTAMAPTTTSQPADQTATTSQPADQTATTSNPTLGETPVVVVPAAVAPAISSQPTEQTVTAGQAATFSVTATGTAPLGYQWKKGGSNISGATASTYTTDATVIADSGAVFTVLVSNSAGSVTSSSASLMVNPSITISAQPAAQAITAGQTAMFSVTATGSGTVRYQWKKGSTVIPGATNSTYTTPAMSYASNGKGYSVVLTDSASTVTSSTATLTVNRTSTLKSYGYVANASDGLYDKTECVQDNNTGLVWEGKTAIGTRDGGNQYTNYDGTGIAQKSDGSNASSTEIAASSNSIGYVNSVNAGSGLCGFNDWRMPTKEEMQGIAASTGSPKIDTTWFPNTQAAGYWTSSPYVVNAGYAWFVYFGVGSVGFGNRYYYAAVRLVRASQ